MTCRRMSKRKVQNRVGVCRGWPMRIAQKYLHVHCCCRLRVWVELSKWRMKATGALFLLYVVWQVYFSADNIVYATDDHNAGINNMQQVLRAVRRAAWPWQRPLFWSTHVQVLKSQQWHLPNQGKNGCPESEDRGRKQVYPYFERRGLYHFLM